MKGWTYTFSASRTPQGLLIAARPYFDRVVAASLGMGEVCDLTISEHVEKRSNAQNRMAWGTVYDQLLEGIGDAAGYDRHERAAAKDLIHEGLTAKYQGTVTDKVTGQEVRKFRTSKASKQEFSDYIEWVARFAATEYGVVIVLPGEAA
jgi:hypothetical protein